MKRILSLLLAVLMCAIPLAACGNEGNDGASEAPSDTTDGNSVDASQNDENSEVPPMENKKTIRIGTYNIKHAEDVSASTGATAEDLRAIADDITSLDLDIVGIQEIDCLVGRSGNVNQLALLSQYTGYKYYYYMRAVEWPDNEYSTAGSAILSKYPIIEGSGSTTELSRGDTWDQVRKLGHVQIDVDGTLFNVFNTHLTPLEPETRAGEFQLIKEAVANKEYCILTGDFNCPSFDEFAVLENLTKFNSDENKFITYPKDQKFMDNILYSQELAPVEGAGGVLENGHSDHSLLWAEFSYAPADNVPAERTLSIGSFNVAGAREVGKDLRVLADDILEQELDIIGLQEVDLNASRSDYVDFMKLLGEYTGYYYQFYEALDLSFYDGFTGSYGIGILSRYPIVSTTNTQLTGPNKSRNIESRTLGHAVIDVNGTEINFFTTHLTIRDDSIRAKEFDLLNAMTSRYGNVILTGDFNNDSLDEFDALVNLSKVNNPDNPYETYPEDHRYIDNVIYSSEFTHVEGSEGMRVNDHSDHYMFYADLKYTVAEDTAE